MGCSEAGVLIKDDELTAMVPVAGKVVALDDVSDPTFASGKMGAGVAIVPSDGKVYAPFDGGLTSTSNFSKRSELANVNITVSSKPAFLIAGSQNSMICSPFVTC